MNRCGQAVSATSKSSVASGLHAITGNRRAYRRRSQNRCNKSIAINLNPTLGYNLKSASPHPRPFSQREKGVEPLAFWKRDWGEGMRRLMGHCGHFGKTAVFRIKEAGA
jgi:hypothetical protein